MNQLKLNQVWMLSLGVILVVEGLFFLGKTDMSLADPPNPPANTEKHLFIWTGDQARKNPDFLAVVNFDEGSANYGKVVTTVPVPGAGATGNEPHHVGLSRDGRVLACGGLLSVLKGQKEVFFFDVSSTVAPKFISSADPPNLPSRMSFTRCLKAAFL